MMTPQELLIEVQTALADFTKKTGRKTNCKLFHAGCGAYSVGVFIDNAGHAFDVEQVLGAFVVQHFCELAICRRARKFVFEHFKKQFLGEESEVEK